MHVFVTGASGLCGTALLPQLVAAGHHVTALARSDKTAEAVKANGATTIVRGDTDNHELLTAEAQKADAVYHLAFNHSLFAVPGGFQLAIEKDVATINALGNGLSKSDSKDKVLIGCSGVLSLDGPDEKNEHVRNSGMQRYFCDDAIHSFGSKGVRTSVLRLSPIVHAQGYEHLFIAPQIALAKKSGYVAYIEGIDPVWPATASSDVGALFVAALEKAPSGSNLHAIGELGIPVRDITKFIAKKLNLELKGIAKEEAMAYFGFLGLILQMGHKVSNEWTKETTGWNPAGRTLFDDLEAYTY